MPRAVFLLLLFFATPAYAEIEGCRYWQRSSGTVEGVPIFLEMWKKGCTKMDFLQTHSPDQLPRNSHIHFDRSPCTDVAPNLKTGIFLAAPQPAKEPSILERSGGDAFTLLHNNALGWSGRTLWCYEPGHADTTVLDPLLAQQSTPPPTEKINPPVSSSNPPVLSPEERRRAMQAEDAERAAQKKKVEK